MKLVHQIQNIRHGGGVAVFAFGKVVCEVIPEGTEAMAIGPAEHEHGKNFEQTVSAVDVFILLVAAEGRIGGLAWSHKICSSTAIIVRK